jgi:hypothetical protein
VKTRGYPFAQLSELCGVVHACVNMITSLNQDSGASPRRAASQAAVISSRTWRCCCLSVATTYPIPFSAVKRFAARALPVVAEQLADAKPPGNRVATPGEIGECSGGMTVDIAGGDMASRAAGFCLCRRDQQGDLRVRLVEVAGVQVERCRVGQGMSKRDSNLHG